MSKYSYPDNPFASTQAWVPWVKLPIKTHAVHLQRLCSWGCRSYDGSYLHYPELLSSVEAIQYWSCFMSTTLPCPLSGVFLSLLPWWMSTFTSVFMDFCLPGCPLRTLLLFLPGIEDASLAKPMDVEGRTGNLASQGCFRASYFPASQSWSSPAEAYLVPWSDTVI